VASWSQQTDLLPPSVGMPNGGIHHVVLCIDNSRSMEAVDVRDERGHKMCARCDAVQVVARKLLEAVLYKTASALVTLVYFDDQARTVARACALTDPAIRSLMGQQLAAPARGTNYSEGWQAIERAIAQADATTHQVVFLTDGRPGELRHLPILGDEPEMSRYNKAEHPSAPAIVRRLARKHRSSFELHAMGVGNDEFRWPIRLVEIASCEGAKAEFRPVAADSFVSKLPAPTAASPNNALRYRGRRRAPLSHVESNSQNYAGGPLSVTMAPPGPMAPPARVVRRSISLAGAFDSVTSSITSSISMGISDRSINRQLRPYNQEPEDAWKSRDGWQSLMAHKLVDQEGADRWQQVSIMIRARPFSKGGQRHAYHMRLDNCAPRLCGDGNDYVAKESRWECKAGQHQEKELSDLKLEIEQAKLAASLAEEFNVAVAESGIELDEKISILPCEIYRISRRPGGPMRYISVERYLDGKWGKSLGNNGYVSPCVCSSKNVSKMNARWLFPHAFSHWSFEHTQTAEENEAMVTDIQGVRMEYTDVTVHTRNRQFGSTDLGQLGFEKFFQTHTCNAACHQLGLERCQAVPRGGAAAVATASTATERVQLIRTKHLRSRKRERNIDTIEMQRAIKHGQKQRGHAPNSVKHTHAGVSVVTAGRGNGEIVGVTAYVKSRKDRRERGARRAQGPARSSALGREVGACARPMDTGLSWLPPPPMFKEPLPRLVSAPSGTCLRCKSSLAFCVCELDH
jgi:hypothetical protein